MFATGKPIFLEYTNGGVLPAPAKSLGINVDQIITINYNFRYTYSVCYRWINLLGVYTRKRVCLHVQSP